MNVNDTKVAIAYIHGRVEAQLEGFAQSLEIPVSDLTLRVATLLLSSPGRGQMGDDDRVSSLLGTTTETHQRVSKMAVGHRTHGRDARWQDAPRKLSGRKSRKHPLYKHNSGIKRYWASMTKEQRSAEMKRRMKVSEKNAAH